MKSGRCPKCQSTEIRTGPTRGGRQSMTNTFNVTWFRRATPTRYVCVSCGYMEQYVNDDARRVIQELWARHAK